MDLSGHNSNLILSQGAFVWYFGLVNFMAYYKKYKVHFLANNWKSTNPKCTMWQTTLIANLIIGNHTFFNSLFRASFPWERENTDVSNRDHYYSISLTKIIHTVDACPVHCRLFSSLTGFYLLDATSTLLILSTKNVNILFVFLRIRNTKKKRCHEMKEAAKLICSAFWIQKESVKLILLCKSIKLEIWVWIFFCTFEVLITCPQEHRVTSHNRLRALLIL